MIDTQKYLDQLHGMHTELAAELSRMRGTGRTSVDGDREFNAVHNLFLLVSLGCDLIGDVDRARYAEAGR